MDSIYSYQDYRKFLKEFHRAQKDKISGFSLAQFSRLADLGSPNYFSLILSGKRNLTITNIHKICSALNLNYQETQFFEALVLLNQSDTALEKNFYSKKIVELRNVQKNTKAEFYSRVESMSMIDKTQQVASLILCSGKSQSEACTVLANELSIGKLEAARLIDKLILAKELTYSEGRLLIARKNVVVNDSRGKNLAQYHFLKNGLTEASEEFDARYLKKKGKFFSILYTARQGTLGLFFDKLKVCSEETVQAFEPLPTEDLGVYRFQFQVYRLRKHAE